MKASEIKTVCIIGAGTMGQQISVPCAIHGLSVRLYDNAASGLENGMKRIRVLLDGFVKGKKISQEEADTAFSRIKPVSDPAEAARDADIVSESVPEDPKLKGDIFSTFNKLCPARTVFTTNTSTLLPSLFAAATGRPEKFIALHFHDVRLTNIVDVMPHPGTSPETVELVRDFAVRIGQQPIVLKKENPGYVFNMMLSELFKAAQTLAAKDVASIEDIDRAWMGVMHTPIGPFGIMDSIGLDTVWKVTDYWAQAIGTPQMLANASFLKQYVDRGELGQKTGRGFYSYPGPDFLDPKFLDDIGKE